MSDIHPSAAVRSCPESFFISLEHHGVIPYDTKEASAISRRLMLSLIVVIFSDFDFSGLSVRTKNVNNLVSNHFLNSLSSGL